MSSTILHNINQVNSNIINFARKYNRKPHDINLIAVSKTVLPDRIEEAIKCGCLDFGENRVEEALEKWLDLKNKYPNINLHLIGHLQSKKIKKAIGIFDYIHSVDSIKLAEKIKSEMDKQNKYPKIFIQINIAQESTKTGIKIEEIDSFINIIRNQIKLNIFGLMCIPPAHEESSPYFAMLVNLAKKYDIGNLSMGMSNDYEAAIATNSNYIRIGTAIFGQR